MCGIFGMFGHKEAGKLTYLGLYALQHRGEEAAGIFTSDGKRTYLQKGQGTVCDVFDEKKLNVLKGTVALGHNRYSTTGSSSPKNIQPFYVRHRGKSLVVAHNGNFVNTVQLHKALEKDGAIFQTTMDSEIVLHLIAKSEKTELTDIIVDALSRVRGSYSLLLFVNDTLVAARDPLGFRPMCLGRKDGAWTVCSETCALDIIGADYVRDVEPGEILFFRKGQEPVSVKPFTETRRAHCIFEYIYFARPDSNIFGHNVYEVRKALGARMAEEAPVDADLVMPVPDSGNMAALGLSERSGIKFEQAMVRNHYIGRTFIQPSQGIRDFRVKIKLNPIKDLLRDKNVIVVDDSIVRGTTSRARVRAIRDAGARKIHMRISCPPIIRPCFYGVDFPTRKELIASDKNVDDIREYIDSDTLAYLSVDGMLEAMPLPKEHFCTACFTGCYPAQVPKRGSKLSIEKG
jgi:amidophosphoribosyltransferase